VVVPIGFSIVTTGAVAKLDLVYQSGFLQEAERVVDGCITDRRQVLARRLENLVRRRMIFPRTNDLKHRVALSRQLLFWLKIFSSSWHLYIFRLILITCQPGLMSSLRLPGRLQLRMASSVIDDCLNVTLKWRASDAVGFE